MKNIICLWMVIGAALWADAQDHRLYKFSLKGTGQYLTWDLESFGLQEKRNGLNELAQLFILKRDVTSGKVLIASAANPTLFVKRSDAGVELAAYEAMGDFYWDVSYLGVPYLGFTDPFSKQLMTWREVSGLQMEMISIPLTGNDDTSGDHYRFTLEHVANVF